MEEISIVNSQIYENLYYRPIIFYNEYFRSLQHVTFLRSQIPKYERKRSHHEYLTKSFSKRNLAVSYFDNIIH